jgi:hypothetical protein
MDRQVGLSSRAMAKRIASPDTGTQWDEYAVEYEMNGETFTYEARDETEARIVRAAVNGRLMVRSVFETPWAT